MEATKINRLATLLANDSAELSAVTLAVDELCADEGPIDESSIRQLLLALSDDYSNIEVVDSLLGRLEVETAWTTALFHAASALALSAPGIFETRVARGLNGSESREGLVALVIGEPGANADTIMAVARELAKNPRPRPGESARSFLEAVSQWGGV